MTEQTLIYVFAVPGILAAYGVAVWLDAWRRSRTLDAEIADYRAKHAASGRSADSVVRVAVLDTVDAMARVHASRARNRRARAESMRVSPPRPRRKSSDVSPGE